MHRNHCCVSIATMVNTPKCYHKRTLPFVLKTVLCLPLILVGYTHDDGFLQIQMNTEGYRNIPRIFKGLILFSKFWSNFKSVRGPHIDNHGTRRLT